MQRAAVAHADALLRLSRRVLGEAATQFVVRNSSPTSALARTRRHRARRRGLRGAGIGSILDYAAEADVPEAGADAAAAGCRRARCSPGAAARPRARRRAARARRVHDEAACDAHVDVFLGAVEAVRDTAPEGFAAVKLTALGNPKLLEAMSTAIIETRNLFVKLDADRDGRLTRAEFARGYAYFFDDDTLDDTIEPAAALGAGAAAGIAVEAARADGATPPAARPLRRRQHRPRRVVAVVPA